MADPRARSGQVDRIFAALSDPTRRSVVDLLRRGPRRAGELSTALDVSPQALSRHLRILRGSGVVEEAEAARADDGRVRVYRLRREPFRRLRSWVDRVEALWADQLAAFAEHVERRRKP